MILLLEDDRGRYHSTLTKPDGCPSKCHCSCLALSFWLLEMLRSGKAQWGQRIYRSCHAKGRETLSSPFSEKLWFQKWPTCRILQAPRSTNHEAFIQKGWIDLVQAAVLVRCVNLRHAQGIDSCHLPNNQGFMGGDSVVLRVVLR